MTWSIVAHDPPTGAFAVAVTTCNIAVGASCPFLRSGVGAVSTQSMSNRYLGPVVLEGLARGLPAGLALEAAMAGDEGRGLRQVHVVDAAGRVAAFTGANCVEWCGSVAGEGFSVAGNMLAGPAVVEATAEVFAARTDLPLPERMMAALQAGQAAGGDKRGRQSAAIQIASADPYPDLDLRVDDHPDPLAELRRLHGVWHGYLRHFRRFLPGRDHPGVFDRAVLQSAIAAAQAEQAR